MYTTRLSERISVDTILTWLTLGLFRFVFVKEGTNVIVTRFGKYVKTLRPGLRSFLFMFGLFGQVHYFYVTDPVTLDIKETYEVDIKEVVFDFPSEKVISADNVEFKVDAIVFFKVVEANKAVFHVNDYVKSLQLTIRSILRDEIGRLNLEEVYVSRAVVSERLRKESDEAVSNWGIDVTQLEIKEFELGDLAAELIEQKHTELEKRKKIMKAQALKEARIEEAKAEKAAKLEEAKALKEYAEMEAEAIVIKSKAEAEAEKNKFDAEFYGYEKIAKVLEEHPGILSDYLQLFNAERISKNLGQGKATTVFLPSNMENMIKSFNIMANKEQEENNSMDLIDGKKLFEEKE
ncbi:SPFH domain-containing protein [Natronospora cellulosivora (SeqCode)]